MTAVELVFKARTGDLSWQERAACAEYDTRVFFPPQGGDSATPKKICRQCPVREACLEYALVNTERFGIWGGLSEKERRHVRRTWRAARSQAALASVDADLARRSAEQRARRVDAGLARPPRTPARTGPGAVRPPLSDRLAADLLEVLSPLKEAVDAR